MKIGIFDSGIGGLSVLHHIQDNDIQANLQQFLLQNPDIWSLQNQKGAHPLHVQKQQENDYMYEEYWTPLLPSDYSCSW